MSAGQTTFVGGAVSRPPSALGLVSMVERLREARAQGDDLFGLEFKGARLIGVNLSGSDLSGLDLSGADLSRADLRGASFVGANLKGATLFEAMIGGAEFMSADLEGANLDGCKGDAAGFGAAKLMGASFVGSSLESATFSSADLNGAMFSGANLQGARFRGATLIGAEFRGADLRGADLTGCEVSGARMLEVDLEGAQLQRLEGYQQASWLGARVVGVDFCGAYLLRRHIMDENYLDEFRRQGRLNQVIYQVWWATSDCGRSFGRWALWTMLIVVVFAGLYGFVALDPGDYGTPLSPLYFSVVTLTTLGYGDVLPTTMAAQALTMTQVVIGYVMLGGLLSIFANKMARRAD